MIEAKALAERFCVGENVYGIEGATWKSAFEYIDINIADMHLERMGAHQIWIESGGHLRRKIRDDSLILSVLRKVLPSYQGPGLVLYRGECKFLYEQGKIGFCWSPEIEVAELFGRGLNALESGGVVLKAYAPTAAVISGPNDHSANYLRENEFTCDPTLLEGMELLSSFPIP
jgi:hypothetical protein